MEGAEERGKIVKQSERSSFLGMIAKKVMTALNSDIDEETARMTERMVVLRIATKHINLWVRQLKMKRKQIGELADDSSADKQMSFSESNHFYSD